MFLLLALLQLFGNKLPSLSVHLPKQKTALVLLVALLLLVPKRVLPNIVQLLERVFAELRHYFLQLLFLAADACLELTSEGVRLLAAFAELAHYLIGVFALRREELQSHLEVVEAHAEPAACVARGDRELCAQTEGVVGGGPSEEAGVDN